MGQQSGRTQLCTQSIALKPGTTVCCAAHRCTISSPQDFTPVLSHTLQFEKHSHEGESEHYFVSPTKENPNGASTSYRFFFVGKNERWREQHLRHGRWPSSVVTTNIAIFVCVMVLHAATAPRSLGGCCALRQHPMPKILDSKAFRGATSQAQNK